MLRQYLKFQDYLKNGMCTRSGSHIVICLSIRVRCSTDVLRFHNTIYLLIIRYKEGNSIKLSSFYLTIHTFLSLSSGRS